MRRTTFTNLALVGGVFLILGIALARHARAQGSSAARNPSRTNQTTGWSFGAYMVTGLGVSFVAADNPAPFKSDMGQGFGADVAYGFNRNYSVFASADFVKQADSYVAAVYDIRHLEVGGRATFRLSDPKFVPYVSASVGRRSISASPAGDDGLRHSVRLAGNMVAAGGGAQWFLTPVFALDGGAELSYGWFDDWTIDGAQSTHSVDASTTTRLKVGARWYLPAK